MGKEARRNQERKNNRKIFLKTFPIRLVKSFTALFFWPVIILFAGAIFAWQDNKWPWQIINREEK
jgi:hypothetical protein